MSKWIIEINNSYWILWTVDHTGRVSATATVDAQEFFLPLPSNITQDIFKTITPEGGIPEVTVIHALCRRVVATADNAKVYYDQWENGYLNGAAGDSVTTRGGLRELLQHHAQQGKPPLLKVSELAFLLTLAGVVRIMMPVTGFTRSIRGPLRS